MNLAPNLTAPAADRPTRGTRAGSRAALDVMLTDAAIEPGPRRLVQPAAALRLGGALARRPRRVARRVGALGAELGRIAAGSSDIAPRKGDRRFGDRAWNDSWVFHRLMQAYLARRRHRRRPGRRRRAGLAHRPADPVRAGQPARRARPDELRAHQPAGAQGDDRSRRREPRHGRAAVRPRRRAAAACRRWSTRAASRSAATSASATAPSSRAPTCSSSSTTGPRPTEVYETPLLVVPPTINKFYVLDLAPGRSLVEHLVGQGHQVFCISWRNPDAEHSHFDFDTYAQAVSEARDAVAEIARPRRGQRARGLLGRDHHRGAARPSRRARAGSARSRA